MKALLLISLLALPFTFLGQNMNNASLQEILKVESDSVVGANGRWQITYKEAPMLVLTDESNDRMRIIMPITKGTSLSKEMLQACLTANFHTALDVKYALSDELLWAVYIHPLSPLTEAQLKSALSQVYSAALTFGTTFSSTDLLFGGGQILDDQPDQTPELNPKRG
ncbi:hypothetical protein [Gilvibacter sediminis]|uniref:hypothetical protein n=1 Tax=Gilvibacter sediminis TaxID=379071 RepID=UPI00234FCB07|nr:hypothetical protein [Gilvibacter sediminis]MDC7998232.1 hypothetical protein [Gilvibacter sediminis]